ncbi:MAG: outer membrane lipoprotein carrier protein LolA [Bacteroidales bacterium]|nr:outer membrane lipoprotein carrier protein LolA [Bacteroidales bacterium]MCF8327105.1 outer membrane lipoprotein carrier protein LolA [Bacteroidales bacterium]
MRKTTIFLVIAFVFAGLLASAQVDNSKSKKILNKASNKLESYQDVSIKFSYNMDNNEHDIHEEKSGSAWIKDDMYRINIQDQIIISDGETVWSFLPGSKEVQVASAKENAENNPLKVLSDWEEKYRSKYIRTETIAGNTIDIIDLVPKEGKSFFKVRVRINQKNHQLVSSTVYDKNSTTYTYIIEEFKTNNNLPDSKFKFSKSNHPDVEVIDLR